MLLLPIIIVLCGTFLYFGLKMRRKNKTLLDISPQPPANFLFGHALAVSSLTNLLPVLSGFIKKYGKTIKLFFGPDLAPLHIVLATVDYKLVEFLLSSNKILFKGFVYKFVKPWLGNGLLLSGGDYWRRHRKILTPAFHFEILKDFVDVFESVGNVFIKKLEDLDGATNLDLQPLVSLCTLDIICETAMGTKIDALNDKNPEYVKNVQKMCQLITRRVINPVKFFDTTYWTTRDFYDYGKTLKALHNFTSRVIASRNRNKITKGKKLAFLDLLLELSDNGKILSETEIREQVDTFMFAGHDTTSTAICFTLYCLATHAKIQNKVLQEQKDLFGDEKTPQITYSDLQNMKYLECVIKESLRLYPPVAVVVRILHQDAEFDGVTIPKGTNLSVFTYGLHRNTEYFPAPEKFYPERFENPENIPLHAYVPFSAGPRNCIGQKFAMLEMKSVISKIIRHFELRPSIPNHQLLLSFEIVLKSENGINIGLSKRL